jgi:hypothetical protein
MLLQATIDNTDITDTAYANNSNSAAYTEFRIGTHAMIIY